MYIEIVSSMSGLKDLRNPFSTALLTSLLFAGIAFVTSIILIFLNQNDYAVPREYFNNGFTDHYLVRIQMCSILTMSLTSFPIAPKAYVRRGLRAATEAEQGVAKFI